MELVRRTHAGKRYSAWKWALQLLFLGYALSLIYPFVWMGINSLKNNREFYKSVWALPTTWEWSNYANAWQEAHIGQYFLNSVWMTAVGTFTTVMSAALPAYVMAKYKFRGSTFIYNLSIFSMLIPAIGTLGPWYMLMRNLGLFNEWGVMLGYTAGIGFNMIVLMSFFKGISWEYAEAAFIDGAGHFRVFFSVMLPLARPGLVAIATVSMIAIWNDYLNPYILIQDPKRYTIGVGLFYLVEKQKYASDFTTLFAAMWIALLPVLIVYAFMQEKLINGFTVGGIKG
ncbi:carbohydrate ABC transporter permease [Cohnella nanjingensis]|uniref:Carbohydrate ABC transporter permease n=1 Tax=Cohnella nanjingensis TaxID=1387779 RepID=A0A7X0RPS9_9BACL|nr:carbohydrate ABC transporter permease [Cohnella nanjingensis]MBB6671444.1 carbohydrate ABC transporter permease [Cohnella nanjingensis]